MILKHQAHELSFIEDKTCVGISHSTLVWVIAAFEKKKINLKKNQSKCIFSFDFQLIFEEN